MTTTTTFGQVFDYQDGERVVIRGGMGGTVVTSFTEIGQHLIAQDNGETFWQDRCDLAREEAEEGWNDFLPPAYVEVSGASSDPENNAYYM